MAIPLPLLPLKESLIFNTADNVKALGNQSILMPANFINQKRFTLYSTGIIGRKLINAFLKHIDIVNYVMFVIYGYQNVGNHVSISKRQKKL